MSFPIPFVAYNTRPDSELFFYNPGEAPEIVPVASAPDFSRGVCGDRAIIYAEVVSTGIDATVSLHTIDTTGVNRALGVNVSVPSVIELAVEVVDRTNPTVVVRYRDTSNDPVLVIANRNNQTTYMGEFTAGLQAPMNDQSILAATFKVSI